MCRTYAKYGLLIVLLAAAGFAVGALVAMYGFIALIWEFPRTWQPLEEVTGAPDAIVALDAENDVFLLRTQDGLLYECQKADCTPAGADWRADAPRCDESTRPRVVSFFPFLLSWNIRVALGCERGYMDIARTVYVVQDRQGVNYLTGGPTMIPTDAGIILVGILGALGGMLAGLMLGVILSIVLAARNRSLAR